MTIAITTPNGNVGAFLTRNLIRAGVRPRLLTRNPDSIDRRLRDHGDSVEVDLTKEQEVIAATAGVDALYAVVPPVRAEDPVPEMARVGRALATAAAENRIARTVFQSSGGAELRRGAGEIDGLAATEVAFDELVVGAGLAVTHLRCAFFFSNLLFQLDSLSEGTVPVLWPIDHRLPWVAPRDIAEMASGLLLGPGWSGRRVQGVHGPRDLSWAEVMTAVSAAAGRPVRAEQIPDDDMRAALAAAGMGSQQVEALVGMAIGLRDGYTPEQDRDATTTTETSIESWSYDVLRPLMDRGTRPDEASGRCEAVSPGS